MEDITSSAGRAKSVLIIVHDSPRSRVWEDATLEGLPRRLSILGSPASLVHNALMVLNFTLNVEASQPALPLKVH